MGEVFKLNHCYNVDCLPAMELFPDNYFDLAVVDPPYFSGPERRGFYGSKVSKIGVHRDYPVSPAWSKPEPEYFKELFRVCRHYIVWGCNYFDYQFPTGRIVWDKCNGNSSFSDCEIAATNLFSSVRMFRYMWSGMMQGKSITEGDTMQGNKSLNEKRIHPTQKPVALYDWIFKNYAEPGQKILDTHLGSGSSRIAAYEAGLGFIGFEIDPFYFQLEEERFSEYSVVDEDGKVTGRHHHHAILQGNLTWQEIKDLWRDSTGRPMGLVKVEPIDLTCSSFERLTTYMTKARARIRRWRQSQGLQKPKTPRPNDTRWSRKRFDEAFALPDDREYWEKKYPGYTLRECEQHITGNNTKHLIVKLKKKPDTRRKNRRNQP